MGTSIFVLFAGAFGGISSVVSDTTIAQLKDQNSEIYKMLTQTFRVFDIQNMQSFTDYMGLASGALDPLSSASVIVRPIFTFLGEAGLSPFRLITVEVMREDVVVRETFRTTFQEFMNHMFEAGFKRINEAFTNN